MSPLRLHPKSLGWIASYLGNDFGCMSPLRPHPKFSQDWERDFERFFSRIGEMPKYGLITPKIGGGTLSGFSLLLPMLEELVLSLSKGGWGMRAIQGFATVTCCGIARIGYGTAIA